MEQEAFNLKEYSTNLGNPKILKIFVQTIHAWLVFATNQIELFAVGGGTPTEQEWSNHPPLSPFIRRGEGEGRSLKKIILVLKTYLKNESSPPCANGMAEAKGVCLGGGG